MAADDSHCCDLVRVSGYTSSGDDVAKVFDLLLCAGALDWVDGQPIVSEELEHEAEDLVSVLRFFC